MHVKKKRKLWGRLKSEPSIQLRERFKQLRSETKKRIRSNYRKYPVKLSESLKDNPRRFWSFHSIKTKSRRLPDSVFMRESVLENHLSRQIYLIYISIQSFPNPMIWFMGILIKRKKLFLVVLLLLQHALAKLRKF